MMSTERTLSRTDESVDDFLFKRPATPPPLKIPNANRTSIGLPKKIRVPPAAIPTTKTPVEEKTVNNETPERATLGMFHKQLERMEMRGLTGEPRYYRFLGIWSTLRSQHNGPLQCHPERERIINDIRNAEKLKSCFIPQKMTAVPDNAVGGGGPFRPSFTPHQKKRFHAIVTAYKYLARQLPIPRTVKEAMRMEARESSQFLPACSASTSTSTSSPVCDVEGDDDAIDIPEVWLDSPPGSETEDNHE